MRKYLLAIGGIVFAVALFWLWCVGYSAYWSGGYEVVVHLRRTGDSPVVGVVLQPLYPEYFQLATKALGSAPRSSPRYLDLFEMRWRRPERVDDEAAPITVHVKQHGKDSTFPWRKTIYEFREEKLALGVYFADGSRTCYVYDIPAPDELRHITAEISAEKGEPGVGADSR